jgi:hypothetical protein
MAALYLRLTNPLATEVTREATQTPPVTGAVKGATKLTTVPTLQPTPRYLSATGRACLTKGTTVSLMKPLELADVLKEREEFIG